jgi:hypothetical protein
MDNMKPGEDSIRRRLPTNPPFGSIFYSSDTGHWIFMPAKLPPPSSDEFGMSTMPSDSSGRWVPLDETSTG